MIALIWGLNATDKKILAMLCSVKGAKMGTIELARALKLTTGRIAQRLDYLASQGLVMREKISLPKGYRYAYFSPDKKELAKLARIRLDEKISEIERALEKGQISMKFVRSRKIQQEFFETCRRSDK